MPELQEFTYPSSDGVHSCHAMVWLPDEGSTPRAVVQLVHGVAE